MVNQVISGMLGISVAFNLYFIFVIYRDNKEMKRMETMMKSFLDCMEEDIKTLLKETTRR